MRKMFQKPYMGSVIELAPERAEQEEFGLAKKERRLCKKCKSVYFKKSWHHATSNESKYHVKHEKLWYTVCPACQMIAGHSFEGELMISDIPENRKLRRELLRLIKNYGQRAFEEDCQHRIIATYKEDEHVWRVTTTENQLARKLAHKIKDVFNKFEIKTKFSEPPDDVERVTVSFQPAMVGKGSKP